MNSMMIRDSYAAVAVRPRNRPAYIAGLRQAQDGGRTETFDRLLYERLDATLAESVSASRQAPPASGTSRGGTDDGSPRL